MPIEYQKVIKKGLQHRPTWILSFETKDTAQVTSKQIKGSRNEVKKGQKPYNKLNYCQAN